MKSTLFTLFAYIAIVISPASAQEDGLHWYDNYKEAIAEAKKTGRPIFLEYRCEP